MIGEFGLEELAASEGDGFAPNRYHAVGKLRLRQLAGANESHRCHPRFQRTWTS
jgi:hypothetical protein